MIFVILLSLTACGEQKNAEGSAPTTVNNGPVEERESRSNVVETDPETGETITTPGTTEEKSFTRRLEFVQE